MKICLPVSSDLSLDWQSPSYFSVSPLLSDSSRGLDFTILSTKGEGSYGWFLDKDLSFSWRTYCMLKISDIKYYKLPPSRIQDEIVEWAIGGRSGQMMVVDRGKLNRTQERKEKKVQICKQLEEKRACLNRIIKLSLVVTDLEQGQRLPKRSHPGGREDIYYFQKFQNSIFLLFNFQNEQGGAAQNHIDQPRPLGGVWGGAAAKSQQDHGVPQRDHQEA